MARKREPATATNDGLANAVRQWRADPSDAATLAGVRAEFLVGQAVAAATGGRGGVELARSVVNLLDRLCEGTVEPNAEIVAAVRKAAARLAELAGEMAGSGSRDTALVDLVERIDAYASGLTDLKFEDAEDGTDGRHGPPLLTVRHDGARVTPGSFDVDACVDAREHDPLPVIVEALQALADRCSWQLESLEAVAAKDADTGGTLRHLVDELYATGASIDRLRQALAAIAGRG